MQEHEYFDRNEWPDKWAENYWEYEGFVLNPQCSGIDRKYFLKFDCLGNGWGLYASYVIGAQWIDDKVTKSLVVTPKKGFEHIPFLSMLQGCMRYGTLDNAIGVIFDIDESKPNITAPMLTGMLSPLLVACFVSEMRKLVKHGLMRDYISRQENLNKAKGRINIRQNERENIRNGRYDRIVCQYDDYSANIPENRLLKACLLACRSLLAQYCLINNAGAQFLSETVVSLNKLLRQFESVGDWNHNLNLPRRTRMREDYRSCLSLAKMIVRRQDRSIAEQGQTNAVPCFWIDMALLFERYVLALLRSCYGEDVVYQFKGVIGERPDFLLHHGDEKLILDTKYMENVVGKIDIIRQLSGYARDIAIQNKLGAAQDKVISCVLIYPEYAGSGNVSSPSFAFDNSRSMLERCKKIQGFSEFYSLSVPVG